MHEEKIRARHLKYFSQLAEQGEIALRGRDQLIWYTRLHDERDNIRAALQWAAKSDMETGLRLAGSLQGFWESLDVTEGVRWLDKFLDKEESKIYSRPRAKALYTKARLLWWAQEANLSHLAAQESLDLYRACGDVSGEIDALLIVAISNENYWNQENIEICQRALELSQTLGDSWRQAQVFLVFSWRDEDYARRISHTKKAVALFKKTGDLEAALEQTIALAELELMNRHPESAQKCLEEAIRLSQSTSDEGTKTEVSKFDAIMALSRRLHNKAWLAYILLIYGRLAFLFGSSEEAYRSLYRSIEISEELGHRFVYYFARTNLGYFFLQQGDTTGAYHLFLDSAQNFQKDKDPIGVAFSLEGIASIFVMNGKHAHAARLIGWADGTREKIRDIRPPLEQVDVDKTIAACLEKMDEVAFSEAYDEGKKMSMDKAVAYALEES